MAATTPRFRQDLVAATVDADGVACVDVRDPVTGSSFRFYDYEFAMAQQLNGQPADDVVGWASATYGMEIDAGAVDAFATQLRELGFLETEGAPLPATDTAPTGPVGASGPNGSEKTREAEVESAPVSQVVNHLMNAMPPPPPSGDSDAYGDFGSGRRDPDSGVSAEAEWSSLEGARTATAAPDMDLLLAEAAAVPKTAPDMVALPREEPTPPPRRSVPEAPDASKEFMEDDATGHWVPKMVWGPGGAGGGPDVQRDRSQWARDLSSTLQTGPHRTSSPGAEETPEIRHVASADHEVTVLADPSAPDPDATPPPILASGVGPAGPVAGSAAPTPPPVRPASTPAPASLSSTDKPLRRRTPTPAKAPPPFTLNGNGSPGNSLPRLPEGNGAARARAANQPPEPPPNLLRDRRQPPQPEAVVMSPFAGNGGEASATPAKLFRVNESEGGQRRSRGAVLAVAVLLALTVGIALYLWRQQSDRAEMKQVRVVAPKPTAVYRWFDGTGAVVGSEERIMMFASAGRVAEVLPAGTTFSAGEIIAKLNGAHIYALEVGHLRSRIGFYEQMRDSMLAVANQPEVRQAEIKMTLKRDQLVQADKNLSGLVVRPGGSGEIADVFVKPGMMVTPQTPVLRIQGGRLRGEFTLSARDWQTATRLAFCRVEVVGLAPRASNGSGRRSPTGSAADSGSPEAQVSPKFVDCKVMTARDDPALGALAAAAAPSRTLVVELPAGTAVAIGQPLRLARARYDAVFPIPREAIVRVGDTDRVYVASRSGIAEPRAVTAIDAGGDEALVTQGLDIGDAVIVRAPAGLRDGSRIKIER